MGILPSRGAHITILCMAKKILFVEDDVVLLEVLQRFLAEAGYEVTVAKDGLEALSVLEREKPDLILLDILLPKLDGFEVLKKIKSDSTKAQIPVVILSNYGSQEDMKRGLELGAIKYLVKASVAPEDIVIHVQRILQ